MKTVMSIFQSPQQSHLTSGCQSRTGVTWAMGNGDSSHGGLTTPINDIIKTCEKALAHFRLKGRGLSVMAD